jgi:hypothetical protein
MKQSLFNRALGLVGAKPAVAQQTNVTLSHKPIRSAAELIVQDYKIPFDAKNIRYCHKRFKKNSKQPRAHGGITIAYMTYTVDNHDLVLIQLSCCSTMDLYNKKIGREVASGRMQKYGPAVVIDTRSSRGYSEIAASLGPDRLAKYKDHIAHAKILDEYMARYAGKIRDFIECSHPDGTKRSERRTQVLLHPRQINLMENFDPFYTGDE